MALPTLIEIPDIDSQSESGELRSFKCFFFTNSDFFVSVTQVWTYCL